MKWVEKELDKITLIKGGKRLPKGHDLLSTPTGHIYIRARDIGKGEINMPEPVYLSKSTFEIIKRYTVSEGDVVITIVGANIGDVGYITEKYAGANLTENALKLTVKDENILYPKFLKYALVGDYQKNKFQQLAGGSAQGKLGLYKIQDFKISVPPLPTQRKITSILSAYDDLIENNLKRIALLEKSARLLYEEWFVHLRFPGYEQAKIVDGVPERWEKGTVKEILELQRGFDLPTQSRDSEGTVPVFASTGIVGYHSKAKVAGPGVVTGRSGTIGKVSYIETDFWPLNTTLWVKKYHLGGPLFAFQHLQTLSLEKFAGGAAVPSLDRKIAHAISIIIPPADLVASFEKTVKPIQGQIQKLQLQNEKLKQARDILLPKLINGEITV